MVVFIGMGLLAMVLGGWLIWNNAKTQDWPTTDGIVVHTEIETVHGSKGSVSYRPIVVYAYSIEGVTYTCDKINQSQSSSEYDWAKDCVEDHPVGSHVTVHYDPDDPSDAVLEAGATMFDAIPLAIGAVFVTIGSLLLWKFH